MYLDDTILDSPEFYYYLKFKITYFNKEFQKHHQIITSYNAEIFDFIDQIRKIKSPNKSNSQIQKSAIITFYYLYRSNSNISIDRAIIEIVNSYLKLRTSKIF